MTQTADFFRLQGFHRLRQSFPAFSTKNHLSGTGLLAPERHCLTTPIKHVVQNLTPPDQASPEGKTVTKQQSLIGLGCSAFARHYWRNHYLFFAPLGTEMFHFPRSSSPALCIQAGILTVCVRGFPHSEISGSKVAYHLPEAYRRLLRPSSSFDVKASTIRPYVV